MTGLFLPFAESIYCARLSSSSQEGPVVQNSIMDANSQTLQVPPWLSFTMTSKVCTQARLFEAFPVFRYYSSNF